MTEQSGGKTAGVRSTEPLYLRVKPEVRDRAFEEAARRGLTVSEFVGSLVLDVQPTSKLGADVGALAVLGQQVVAALAALPPEALQAREALTALRRAIIDQMLERRDHYDGQLDRRDAEGRWG